MIQKHAIPILEFDDNPQAVIMPNHEGLDLQLPKKCIYAFLEEEIDRYAQELVYNRLNLKKVREFYEILFL